jgi:hypothetical protein
MSYFVPWDASKNHTKDRAKEREAKEEEIERRENGGASTCPNLT